jgi:hypothetical protein
MAETVNSGRDLEEYVRQIYLMLLNMKDEGVEVQRNARISGKSGAVHEVDVYYEFKRAGLTHKVAIECKHHVRAIDKGGVSEFALKIIDLHDTKGVMISARGYQDGAVRVAQHYDIDLKTTDELPSLPHLFGSRLASVALPGEDYLGEPFWVIMELRNGRVTGSFYGTEQNGRQFIPLFFSRYHAEILYRQCNLSTEQWCVRGLPRYALRAFILLLGLFQRRGIEPMILFLPPGATDDEFAGLVTNAELLKREYYCGEIPTVEVPG